MGLCSGCVHEATRAASAYGRDTGACSVTLQACRAPHTPIRTIHYALLIRRGHKYEHSPSSSYSTTNITMKELPILNVTTLTLQLVLHHKQPRIHVRAAAVRLRKQGSKALPVQQCVWAFPHACRNLAVHLSRTQLLLLRRSLKPQVHQPTHRDVVAVPRKSISISSKAYMPAAMWKKECGASARAP